MLDRSYEDSGDRWFVLFAEELTKQFFRTFRAFFSHKHRLCFPYGITDKFLLVQPIQRIPIVPFQSP